VSATAIIPFSLHSDHDFRLFRSLAGLVSLNGTPLARAAKPATAMTGGARFYGSILNPPSPCGQIGKPYRPIWRRLWAPALLRLWLRGAELLG